MNGLRPAATATAILLLATLAGDVWRTLWLQNTMMGIAGGPLLNWVGPGMTGTGWWSWIALSLLLGVITVLGSLLAVKSPLRRFGWPMLALSTALLITWTLFISLLGLGNWLDTTFHGSLLFLTYPHPTTWGAWGRWIFDGAALLSLAILLGFGPSTATARRGVFVLLLVWFVDQSWRIAVTVLSGSLPFLWTGLGPLDSLQSLVWWVMSLLGIGFVAITGNLTATDGPSRRGLLIGVAIAGLVYGLEGSALYALGLLHALGFETQLLLPMPFYDGLLGLHRVGLLFAGGLAVGLGHWRESESHTTTHEA